MPNTKQAIKRMKVTAKKTLRNRNIKGNMKMAIRRFNEAIEQGPAENARNLYTEAVKFIDKSVSKGVVHKNTAARKKSRMAKKLNKSASAGN